MTMLELYCIASVNLRSSCSVLLWFSISLARAELAATNWAWLGMARIFGTKGQTSAAVVIELMAVASLTNPDSQ